MVFVLNDFAEINLVSFSAKLEEIAGKRNFFLKRILKPPRFLTFIFSLSVFFLDVNDLLGKRGEWTFPEKENRREEINPSAVLILG
jgi:hypothetical protein